MTAWYILHMNDKSVGKRIAYERNLKNLSQGDLADLLGWENGQSRLSKYENDHRRVSIDHAKDIARALKIDLDKIITKEEAAEIERGSSELTAETLHRVNAALLKASDEKRQIILDILGIR
jgi:transcriptional regulator with XRE-family HTH domain